VTGEIALHILVQKHLLPNGKTKAAPVDVGAARRGFGVGG
jgi:hypothetical protein